LTGLLNRRAFFERTAAALAEDAARPLCAVIMDIDHFKSVNDAYGHDTGDEVLCGVSACATQLTDLVGRFGGEEFALIHQDRPFGEVYELVESLRQRIAAIEFCGERGPFRVTCSFGVAERRDGDTIDTLLKKADVALYAAKSAGRNRVVKFEPRLAATTAGSGSGKIRMHARRSVVTMDVAEIGGLLGS